MANFMKQFPEEIVLPDGSIASSVADVDKYLKANGLAHAGDFSDEYIKNIRYQQEQDRHQSLWADFLYNYKRIIWK